MFLNDRKIFEDLVKASPKELRARRKKRYEGFSSLVLPREQELYTALEVCKEFLEVLSTHSHTKSVAEQIKEHIKYLEDILTAHIELDK